MPIEDVNYLKNNSIKQSYIFLVDSADRDRIKNPTPSEYVVEFTTPFANVIGMEVLDASIPRTMYNVDLINNKIGYYIYLSNEAPVYKTAEVPIGDYTIQTLAPAVTAALSMHPGDNSAYPAVNITAAALSSPPDVRNILQFTCPYPFSFDMRASTMAETLGFDLHTEPTEAAVPDLSRRYEPLDRQLYGSVNLASNVALGVERTIFEGPRGVVRQLPVSGTTRVAQRFLVESEGYLSQVFIAFASGSVARWEVREGFTLSGSTYLTGGNIAVSYTDGALSDSSRVLAKVDPTKVYWLIVDAPAIGGASVYYNDQLSEATTMYVSDNGGALWSYIDADGIFYQLSAKIIVQDAYRRLVAPGMYTLVGPRYLVLRCPEIEESSLRSLAYSRHCLGLAKFRLGVVGYSENRLDFSKVPTREFHPIGKLSKITLRFTLPSGELYDFKGVNHTVTFALHYYEPTPNVKFDRSVIQPNYTGNMLEYMFRQEEQESDSEDQEEDFSRDRLDDYRQRELMYLPENLRLRHLDLMRELGEEEDD